MNRISIRIFSIVICLGTLGLHSQSNTQSAKLSVTNTNSANKLTIENCFNPKFYPKNARLYGWITQHQLAEVVDGVLYTVDVRSLSKTPLIKVDSFINMAKTAVKATAGEEIQLFGMPIINWTGDYQGWFEAGRFLLSVDFKKPLNDNLMAGPIQIRYTFHAAKDEVQATEFSSNGAMVGVVKNNDLYITRNDPKVLSSDIRVTDDGGNGIVYGQSVHRNEFGISKGLFWSPSNDKLAFYRMDEQRVTDYPMFGIQPRPAKANSIKYPMAGDSSHTVTVGVYHLESKRLVYLNTQGSYDHYLTNITWTPDGKYIYVSWVNRDQNKMELRKYDGVSGALMSVDYQLSHPKYVEPESGPIFLPNSNTDFVLQTEADGWNHLYLFRFIKGKPVIRQITKGRWEVTEVLGFTKDGKYLLFENTMASPLERHVHALDWANSKVNAQGMATPIAKGSKETTFELTPFAGTNKCSFNQQNGYLLNIYSSYNTPRQILAIDAVKHIADYHGKTFQAPSVIFESPNPISSLGLGKIEVNKRMVNGTEQYCRIFYPSNFDPNKKYPVVVYVYGGPHAQMITNTWLGGGNLWMHYMAENGYIVYTQDNRGSAHRGLAFENAVHRQLGTAEMADQLDGLAWLKSQSWCDSTRVGIHGWSFGGFMTTSLMTRTTGKYKVGVAGGPVIDWSFYEIMYTERYMDRPEENPEGFKNNNLLGYADKLEGRLLMIHGADDDVVVWQHSLMFVDKAVKARNAQLDYYVYPGHKHNVVGPDRVHLYKKISQYFFDFL
ncbi:MAG: S9 family peptidase [Bacteroidetes bacterium]|nr:S9 family peptidase [Bacteroidota bacterium]